MPSKNLRISEIVHEELLTKKRRDESFDEVLRRELGITPSSISELCSFYPKELQSAAKWIDSLLSDDNDEDQYNTVITEEDEFYVKNYDSVGSGRTIIQLEFSTQEPLIEINYRNQSGELEKLGTLAQEGGQDTAIVDVDFIDPQAGSQFDDIGTYVVSDSGFGEIFDASEGLESGIKHLQERSYERWG